MKRALLAGTATPGPTAKRAAQIEQRDSLVAHLEVAAFAWHLSQWAAGRPMGRLFEGD